MINTQNKTWPLQQTVTLLNERSQLSSMGVFDGNNTVLQSLDSHTTQNNARARAPCVLLPPPPRPSQVTSQGRALGAIMSFTL